MTSKILIVEDEAISAEEISQRLQDLGYDVAGVTGSGEEAVDLALSVEPDLILMDIRLMGPMSGIQAAAKIHEDIEIPIVYLTAYSDDDTLDQAKQTGPFGYLLKPFDERTLYTTIEMALFKRSMEVKLEQKEVMLSGILNSMTEGLITTDRDGLVTYLNPMAEQILEATSDEVCNTPLNELLNIPQLAQLISGPEPKFESKQEATLQTALIETPAGRKFFAEYTLSGLKTANVHEGLLLVFRDVSVEKKLQKQLAFQKTHDALTGLLLRQECELHLDHSLNRTKLGHSGDALILIELDRFDLITECCGFGGADQLLILIADTLRSGSGRSAPAFRIRSDLFAVLVEGRGRKEIKELARRYEQRLSAIEFDWEDQTFDIKVHLCAAMIDEAWPSPSHILTAAEAACRKAKEGGTTEIPVIGSIESQVLKRAGKAQWLPRLNRAVQRNQFCLYRQTIKPNNPEDSGDHFEILLRLYTDEGDLVEPGTFLPPAESFNFMPKIDRWVVRKALEQCMRFYGNGLADRLAMCSINLSGQTLSNDHILDEIFGLLADYEVLAPKICFEITETTAIASISLAAEFIEEVKKYGCSFALDDFGIGMSSFGYLSKLPVDFLKIDGMFVRNMMFNPNDHAIVRAIHNVGVALGLKTIAECVDQGAIIRELRRLGVDYCQGFAIAEPERFSLSG